MEYGIYKIHSKHADEEFVLANVLIEFANTSHATRVSEKCSHTFASNLRSNFICEATRYGDTTGDHFSPRKGLTRRRIPGKD